MLSTIAESEPALAAAPAEQIIAFSEPPALEKKPVTKLKSKKKIETKE